MSPPPETPPLVAPRKKGMGGSLILGLLLAFGVGFLIAQGVGEARRMAPVKSGAKAPDFNMAKLEGGTLSLGQLRGKVVMLDFWATWCPPCREEMPSLVKLAKQYEGKGLAFVAASRDDADSWKDDVGSFSAQYSLSGLGQHVVFADDETSDAYKLEVLPTMFFIGPKGELLGSYSGYTSEDTLRDRIERALAEAK